MVIREITDKAKPSVRVGRKNTGLFKERNPTLPRFGIIDSLDSQVA